MLRLLIFTVLLVTQGYCFGADSYTLAVSKFSSRSKAVESEVKRGSRPFFIGQGRPTKTVLMLHGLSDSPGSLKALAKVYQKNGYNVIAPLLRDHGRKLEYRREARKKVRLSHWREDVDYGMELAFLASGGKKVHLLGYSMGGALALDTAVRYESRISSLVLVAPMFKMRSQWASSLAGLVKHIKFSGSKGIRETAHFYPDIALNQIQQASKLARYLEKNVIKSASKELLSIPKLVFLTSADSTIQNQATIEHSYQLGISKKEIYIYDNTALEAPVLHRDLPMSTINSNGGKNVFLSHMLDTLDHFIQ